MNEDDPTGGTWRQPSPQPWPQRAQDRIDMLWANHDRVFLLAVAVFLVQQLLAVR